MQCQVVTVARIEGWYTLRDSKDGHIIIFMCRVCVYDTFTAQLSQHNWWYHLINIIYSISEIIIICICATLQILRIFFVTALLLDGADEIEWRNFTLRCYPGVPARMCCWWTQQMEEGEGRFHAALIIPLSPTPLHICFSLVVCALLSVFSIFAHSVCLLLLSLDSAALLFSRWTLRRIAVSSAVPPPGSRNYQLPSLGPSPQHVCLFLFSSPLRANSPTPPTKNQNRNACQHRQLTPGQSHTEQLDFFFFSFSFSNPLAHLIRRMSNAFFFSSHGWV